MLSLSLSLIIMTTAHLNSFAHAHFVAERTMQIRSKQKQQPTDTFQLIWSQTYLCINIYARSHQSLHTQAHVHTNVETLKKEEEEEEEAMISYLKVPYMWLQTCL
jgi:hypothetical protein